eukprot:scaffold1035_cov192-Ochromonas_danica.AAC.9
MSANIPTVSDTSWAVGGRFRHDYGGPNVTHFCVFLSGDECIQPRNNNFTQCVTRCFGYGFTEPAIKRIAENRSVIDVYSGMNQWPDDGQVDLWEYPSNCSELATFQKRSCTYSGTRNTVPSFNPQGYAFTFAGSGVAGFEDGDADTARFYYPQDVAVDEYGNVFVADTSNHAIRMIHTNGSVITIAGKGPSYPGYVDGVCSSATFSNPKGLDVRHEMVDGIWTTVILVADTGNHRIRKISYNSTMGLCNVKCFTGLCGNNTLSASDFKFKATPLTGYADGSGLVARFSAPESVAFLEGDLFVVADTGNFLVRLANATDGTTWTLAGSVVPGERDADGNPLPGCTPPCMQGQQGYRDGNLTYAQFYNPLDVTRGPNNTVWVVDEQRVRIIELPNVNTTIYGIHSRGRVSTIAGTSLQGFADGIGDKSTFFYSSGLFVNDKGVAYVVDEISCRVRRITPYPLVSQHLTCASKIIDIMRPSGCVSYDMPIDKVGRKISRVEGNIQYNYGWPNQKNYNQGTYIKNCVAVPPPDRFDKHFVNITGDNLVIDDHRVLLNEFSEQGMALLVTCPASCTSTTNLLVQGTHWYSEYSSICRAAIHDGKLTTSGGIILVTIERREYLNSTSAFLSGSTQNGVTSTSIPSSTRRIFSIAHYNISNNMVHSIAGRPSAPLQSVCNFSDGQPATLAMFDNPAGISARYGTVISDSEYLYVADKNNHRIRAVSAVCTFICENGGRCVGDDTCQCPSGWHGIDCTIPVCSTPCGNNSVCVAPNTCSCKPGYNGTECNKPLCQQRCHNGGFCSAPDTCTCQTGWFDANCTTPVCSQTCGNGGNCTAPNKCACPEEWTGKDCRTPVCKQTCHNNGYCVAPNTCACSPQWTNYDCSAPVCHQGYFDPYPGSTTTTTGSTYFSVNFAAYPTYKNCDMQTWCNDTNEFECDQSDMSYDVIRVPSGPYYRKITGRKTAPTQCYPRYSPFTPYTSNSTNAWRGYFIPTNGHTGPWTYSPDRQVAYVNWLNQSQGRYVCANGGVCVSPEICACAPGWSGSPWEFGVCILEFDRNCTTSSKEYDLHSDEYHVYVQDTDISYRPRITYDDLRVHSRGRWKQSTGKCVDQVVRGCFNNGTCIAPNTCRCATGWKGSDCSVPICKQTCYHHGNCTNPNVCTCEKGWSGVDCSIPICAQECQNKGVCVAPDTCQCYQFNTSFYDGRIAGGRPLFRDENGDPLKTGWTGYDCSIPICVQAEKFLLNVPSSSPSYVSMGGHGADALESCTDSSTGDTLPRCPLYDIYLTGNNGKSFQTGCGWDPLDTGCCIRGSNNYITCYKCTGTSLGGIANNENAGLPISSNHTFYCAGEVSSVTKQVSEWETLSEFLDSNKNFLICGKYHQPRDHDPDVTPQDYGVAKYYVDVLDSDKSNYNYRSLGSITGVGSVYGLDSGRHKPIQEDLKYVVKTTSVLWMVHPEAPRGITGWTGTDCSMPMCAHGYYDPFCTDLPQAPGGEGCYRCANGGNCTAPDVCTCATGWTGYDCKTPVCETVADPLTRLQLGTIHEDKIIDFESDPCGVKAIHGVHGWKGRKYARGNCTQPNECTCLCKIPYDKRACRKAGRLCNGPWQDNLVRVRNLLANRGPEFTFGTTDCRFGFEGNVDEMNHFTTCHQTIYFPTSTDRDSLALIIAFSVVGFFGIIFYRFASVRLRRKFLLAKIERRRTKRSSEESMLSAGSGKFSTNK